MRSPTVLVVDDDEDIRELTQMALESGSGWQVLTADSGVAAIEMALEHRPDAVLLDMMMPGMDGLATFEKLQDDEFTRAIPVILFTAKSQVGQPWTDYGFSGVIAKPYDALTLGNTIAELLDWPRPC